MTITFPFDWENTRFRIDAVVQYLVDRWSEVTNRGYVLFVRIDADRVRSQVDVLTQLAALRCRLVRCG
jgi:hypothetical protein